MKRLLKQCDWQLTPEVLNCTFTDLNENVLKDSMGFNAVFAFYGGTISSPEIKRDKSLNKLL